MKAILFTTDTRGVGVRFRLWLADNNGYPASGGFVKLFKSAKKARFWAKANDYEIIEDTNLTKNESDYAEFQAGYENPSR